jgi:hypothetical protein
MEQGVKTILIKNSHTHQLGLIDPTPVAEDEFEPIVISTLRKLYPNCLVFEFKPTIMYNGTGWQPDLAVVSKDLSFWFVVEVEIACHSLQKHVLPQVKAFRLGDYGEQACTILARELNVSEDHAKTLVRYVPRYVAVVTNHEDETWSRALAAENTQLITIASYEGQGADRTALLIHGTLAAAQQNRGFGKVIATMQQVILPAGSFWENGTYRITDPSGCANWTCQLEGTRAWLSKKQGLIQLHDGCWVHFVQQGEVIEMRPLLSE